MYLIIWKNHSLGNWKNVIGRKLVLCVWKAIRKDTNNFVELLHAKHFDILSHLFLPTTTGWDYWYCWRQDLDFAINKRIK